MSVVTRGSVLCELGLCVTSCMGQDKSVIALARARACLCVCAIKHRSPLSAGANSQRARVAAKGEPKSLCRSQLSTRASGCLPGGVALRPQDGQGHTRSVWLVQHVQHIEQSGCAIYTDQDDQARQVSR